MTKADDFRELVDEVLGPPKNDYVPGWCEECNRQVWISTEARPSGMARFCEDHLPLSDLIHD